MQARTITVPGYLGGNVSLKEDGTLWVDDIKLIGREDTARQYAHAIMELIGAPVPGKGETAHVYIAVSGEAFSWSTGNIIDGMSEAPNDDDYAIEELTRDVKHAGEYHIFRRVATVGPIPQLERKVTRYE